MKVQLGFRQEKNYDGLSTFPKAELRTYVRLFSWPN